MNEKIPKKFWTKAMDYAIYLSDWSPTRSV